MAYSETTMYERDTKKKIKTEPKKGEKQKKKIKLRKNKVEV